MVLVDEGDGGCGTSEARSPPHPGFGRRRPPLRCVRMCTHHPFLTLVLSSASFTTVIANRIDPCIDADQCRHWSCHATVARRC